MPQGQTELSYPSSLPLWKMAVVVIQIDGSLSREAGPSEEQGLALAAWLPTLAPGLSPASQSHVVQRFY